MIAIYKGMIRNPNAKGECAFSTKELMEKSKHIVGIEYEDLVEGLDSRVNSQEELRKGPTQGED